MHAFLFKYIHLVCRREVVGEIVDVQYKDLRFIEELLFFLILPVSDLKLKFNMIISRVNKYLYIYIYLEYSVFSLN